MRRNFYIFIFLFVLFWLETGLRNVFSESSFIPQFALLFVVLIGIEAEFSKSVAFAMVAGLLGELHTGLYFGTVMLVMLVVTSLVKLMTRSATARTLSLSSIWFLVPFITLTVPLIAFVYNLGASGLSLTTTPFIAEYYSWSIAWQALANLIVFYAIQWIFKFFFNE